MFEAREKWRKVDCLQPWKTRGHGDRLLQQRFPLDSSKQIVSMRRVGHWTHLPREVVDSLHRTL